MYPSKCRSFQFVLKYHTANLHFHPNGHFSNRRQELRSAGLVSFLAWLPPPPPAPAINIQPLQNYLKNIPRPKVPQGLTEE